MGAPRRSSTAGSSVRGATPEDWDGIERLLTDRHLPTDGARDHLSGFVVAIKGAALLGCAAIERYGDVGLLRSVAVIENVAGRGVGAELLRATLDRARALGLREIYLLTTTAARYFPRFGFEVVGREGLPSALEASEELRGACPASAVAMRLTL
jgi:N-acetylglutamate synthase-like GNAT family acetyltransferase